jgi:hypothetical protein
MEISLRDGMGETAQRGGAGMRPGCVEVYTSEAVREWCQDQAAAAMGGEVFAVIGWIVFAGLLAAHVYGAYRIVKDGDGELLAWGRLERRRKHRRMP